MLERVHDRSSVNLYTTMIDRYPVFNYSNWDELVLYNLLDNNSLYTLTTSESFDLIGKAREFVESSEEMGVVVNKLAKLYDQEAYS